MRQVVDTLVWLAMIVVVAGVVYFTPRLANYVTSLSGHGPDSLTYQGVAYQVGASSVQTR
jgi:hypothetical protein